MTRLGAEKYTRLVISSEVAPQAAWNREISRGDNWLKHQKINYLNCEEGHAFTKIPAGRL